MGLAASASGWTDRLPTGPHLLGEAGSGNSHCAPTVIGVESIGGTDSLVARLQNDLPRQTIADDLADLKAVLVTLHLLLVVTADLLG